MINIPILTAKEILSKNNIKIDCIKHTKPLVAFSQPVEERVVRVDINNLSGSVTLITAFFPIIDISEDNQI
ncbi:MAG: hypothetical protein ACOX15_02295 [Tepidanaerobacteraceae bacterium]